MRAIDKLCGTLQFHCKKFGVGQAPYPNVANFNILTTMTRGFAHTVICLSVVMLISTSLAHAQSGTLKGYIKDADTKDPLVGASVALHQTKLGAIANADGYFEIRGIPEGTYEVRVSAVGYRARFKQVHIYAGKTETVEFALQAASVTGDEVVVSASRYEQNKLDLPVTISIVPMKQIDLLPTPSLDRALETIPGVDVIRSGGIGSSNLQIRGSNGFTGGGLSTRVLMLYDGFPMNSADANSVVWQAINVANLERLEVVKGATSAMYGSAAMGGVINAISLLPREFTVRAKFMNGIYDNPPAGVKPFPGINRPYFYSGNVLIGDQIGAWSYSAVYSRINDPGYRDAGQFYSNNINLSIRYQLSASQFLQLSSVLNWAQGGVAYGWTNVGDPLGVPPGPVFINGQPRIVNGKEVIGRYFLSDDEIHRQSQLLGLTYNVLLSSSASWETKVHFNRSYFKVIYYPAQDIAFDQFDQNSNFIGNFQRYSFGKVIRRPYDPNDPTTFNDSDAQRYGLFSRLLWMQDAHKLSAGIEGAFNAVRSSLYSNASDFNIGAFFQDEVQVTERFKITAGLRFDYHRLIPSTVSYIDQIEFVQQGREIERTETIQTQNLWQISPRLAASYQLDDATALRASVGRSFRAPTIGERFITQAGFFLGNPNPALNAERLTSFEIGLFKSFSRLLSIDVAAYFNHYDNLIESININSNASALDISTSVFQFINTANANILGVEVALTAQPVDPLTIQFNYAWMRATGSTPDNILGGNRNPPQYQNWLPYRPEHNLSFRAELAFKGWLPDALAGGMLSLSGRYVSRINAVRIVANSEGLNYPGNFFLLDTTVRWQLFERITLTGMILNLANTQYEELETYRAPGRSFHLGVEFGLN